MFLRSLIVFSAMLLSCPVISSNSALADEVYRWKDAEGKVHYSSKPRKRGDRPAVLPEIQRENLGKKINRIKVKTPPNCQKHGGVDCSRGADSDGSAICLDGFSEATISFQFACSQVRVQAEMFLRYKNEPSLVPFKKDAISKISQVGIKKGQRARLGDMKRPTPTALQINVRNLGAVSAKNVRTFLVIPGKRTRRMLARGPKQIKPYGLANYTIPISRLDGKFSSYQFQKMQFKVNCTNCRSTLRK